MNDEDIIAYLLGELSDEEMENFEDRCFSEEDWRDQLEAVEGDLIDGYLRGELNPERKGHFEQNYLITEARRERVCVAAALLRHVDELNALAKAAAVTPGDKPRADSIRMFWAARSW